MVSEEKGEILPAFYIKGRFMLLQYRSGGAAEGHAVVSTWETTLTSQNCSGLSNFVVKLICRLGNSGDLW